METSSFNSLFLVSLFFRYLLRVSAFINNTRTHNIHVIFLCVCLLFQFVIYKEWVLVDLFPLWKHKTSYFNHQHFESLFLFFSFYCIVCTRANRPHTCRPIRLHIYPISGRMWRKIRKYSPQRTFRVQQRERMGCICSSYRFCSNTLSVSVCVRLLYRFPLISLFFVGLWEMCNVFKWILCVFVSNLNRMLVWIKRNMKACSFVNNNTLVAPGYPFHQSNFNIKPLDAQITLILASPCMCVCVCDSKAPMFKVSLRVWVCIGDIPSYVTHTHTDRQRDWITYRFDIIRFLVYRFIRCSIV